MRQRLTMSLPAVRDIHHLHVWGLTQEKLMLTMHVVIDGDTQDPSGTVRSIKALLAEDYGIDHSTIEIETDRCADHDE